jgi:hypothetical protein
LENKPPGAKSVKRFLSVACLFALVFAGLLDSCPAQEADPPAQGAKAAAKEAAPATRPAATTQANKDWTAAELRGTPQPYAEITLAPTGKPLLAIRYPWQVHARPSVEVRWLGDDEADTGEIRPLQFVADLMKGEILSAVYDCRDKAAQTPLKKTLKVHRREFEVFGDRNLLGKPAATIVFPEQATGTDRAARAVFFLLDSWAVDPRTLWLELPAADFTRPGRIRVWFYREGNVLWWKTLAWPGLK